MLALKLLAILGTGVVAGVFFAFSSFVMKALARLKPSEGIIAMQSINITVINPLFMTTLFGTAVLCIFLAVLSMLKWHQLSSIYLLLSCLLYIFGTVGVTVVFNVPLNDALAKVTPNSTEAAEVWDNYLTNWSLWNHVRTIAALLATLFLLIALA
ncbi:MAG: DUF1772 domain-containing protein [Pleurocapsa sp.]